MWLQGKLIFFLLSSKLIKIIHEKHGEDAEIGLIDLCLLREMINEVRGVVASADDRSISGVCVASCWKEPQSSSSESEPSQTLVIVYCCYLQNTAIL